MDDFLQREPQAQPYFHPWYGSKELVSSQPRYCLWLGDCLPQELAQMPLCQERSLKVQEFRLSSSDQGTRNLAKTPTRFHVEVFPTTKSLIIPQTSTSNRAYLPLMFIDPNTFASNLVVIVPGATLYHFSILTSHLNMLWTQAVGNTLGTGCRYTIDPVYINFPWPQQPKPELVTALEQSGQAILDARAAYPDKSLDYLYHPKTMPQELKDAFINNERLVHQAYGLEPHASDAEVLSRLHELHRAHTAELDTKEKQELTAQAKKKAAPTSKRKSLSTNNTTSARKA